MDVVTLRAIALIGGSALCGAAAWGERFWTLPLALLVPAFWHRAQARWTAGAVILTYQLAATRGAPIGFKQYYHTWWGAGVALWLGAGLIVMLPWLVCWSRSAPRRLGMISVAVLVTAIPPIGIIGWVHPITAAGALFPGFAWAGLLATLAVMVAVAMVRLRWLPAVAGLLIAWGGTTAKTARAPEGWAGIDTRAVVQNPLDHYERQLELMQTATRADSAVVVFPESAGGLWTGAAEQLWMDHAASWGRKTVLLGAEVPEPDGQSANSIVCATADGCEIVYKQRMPVPISMWRPWTRSGTRAYWFSNPVVDVKGVRAAMLICHEQVLVWPILHSLTQHPRLIVGCANAWWCSETTIPAIERNATQAWARLFNLPCVVAINLSPASR